MRTLNFNSKPSRIMHMDLNSCFATIEQQANPQLRGKPVAVAAYVTPNGCILAPSVEAKRFGVRTGMRVKDGKVLCPELIILPSDPWKYRNVHLSLRKVISRYTSDYFPKSIDEFVLDLQDCPCLRNSTMEAVALEIKRRIKREVGDWLTVSVGISTNRFLAKLASNLKKPDGLQRIDKGNFRETYSRLRLVDLPYIKLRNALRLGRMGIFSVLDFYGSPLWKLKAAFESVNGYYWYTRLRGWEVDDTPFGRKSYSNSYALPKPLSTPEEVSPILAKLVTKMSERLRHAGYKAKGVHLAVSYRDGIFWHRGISFSDELFDTRDIYKKAYRIFCLAPYKKPIRDLAVSCFNLKKAASIQLNIFEDIPKKEDLNTSIDRVNGRWGEYVVTIARMAGTNKAVPDRIAFGGIKELEEFTLS